MAFLTGRCCRAASLAAALTTAALTSPARAQDASDPSKGVRGIVVQGTGLVQVAPDFVRLSLGVETRGRNVAAVAQDNARKTNAVIRAVKAAGVAAADIRTTDYTLAPTEDYGASAAKSPGIASYTASNSVIVTVRKIADAGRIIDAAVQAGGNAASGIQYELNDANRASARNAAIAKAVADARSKALAIAKATSALNLQLVAVQEGGRAQGFEPSYGYAPNALYSIAPTTPLQPGTTTVAASVTLVYSFTAPNAPGP